MVAIPVVAWPTEPTSPIAEPNHADDPQPEASVWYSWTPAVSASVVVETDTCAPDGTFGPDILAVYTGSDLGSLTPEGADSEGRSRYVAKPSRR